MVKQKSLLVYSNNYYLSTGKQTYVFIAVIIVWSNIVSNDPFCLEVKLGEINKDKDKIEFIWVLLTQINVGLTEMNMNEHGDCYMTVLRTAIIFSSINNDTNEQVCFWIHFFNRRFERYISDCR